MNTSVHTVINRTSIKHRYNTNNHELLEDFQSFIIEYSGGEYEDNTEEVNSVKVNILIVEHAARED